MKKAFVLFLMLVLASAGAYAQDAGFGGLAAGAVPPAAFDEPAALYCGVTQGAYRRGEAVIDLAQPFVCFGQYDCWVMVAQGTPEDFGPVGWIEGGLFDAQDAPELSFDDAYAAMIEEDAPVTDDPLHPDRAWDAVLPRGTQVTVLQECGSFLYIQTEIDGQPARVFVPSGVL